MNLSNDKNGNLQGQPQCLKKVKTVGFPLGSGNCNFGDEGAFAPTFGAGDVSRVWGLHQESSSCWNVIVAVEYGDRKIELRRGLFLEKNEEMDVLEPSKEALSYQWRGSS